MSRYVDPKTGGEKDTKPERHDLIPQEALDELARVYGYGASKYAEHNYLRGYPWGLSMAAFGRHYGAWRQGESYDPESGQHHLMHAVWHLIALYMFERHGLGTDNRISTFLKEQHGQPGVSSRSQGGGEDRGTAAA